MTSQEFEDFLKTVNIINGWREGPEIIDRRHFFEIGDGWLKLVHNLIEELIWAGWDRRLIQCKEKYGSLRFYINGASAECFDIIDSHEFLSRRICEECAAGANVVNINGWLKTICNKCNQNKEDTNNDYVQKWQPTRRD